MVPAVAMVEDRGMSSTSPGDPGPPTDTESPYDGGPRVSWDDVKDLGRIRRSTTNKRIAGVAGGIARHLDIDPVVVRIAFVVLALFGGGGILLYGACWLFVPDERTHQAVINVDHRSRTVILAIVGVLAGLSAIGDSLGGFGFPWPMVVIAIGIVVMLSMKNRYHGPLGEEPAAQPGADEPGAPSYAGYRPPAPLPEDPRRNGPVLFWFTMALSLVAIGVLLTLELAGVDLHPAAYPAAVVGACGLMLLVGAFYGRAGGLIPIGLLAALTTLLLSVATPVSGDLLSVGQTKVSPDTLADLDERYAVGMGEIKIDLTETDLEGAENQALDLDVGMGHIQVLVPEKGLAVEVDADIGIGEIKLFDDKYSSSIDDYHRDGDADDPLLTITADGRIGQIEILTPEDLR